MRGGNSEDPEPHPQTHLQTVHFESASHMGNLLGGLYSLQSRGLLLDVTLIAGGQQFKAHRVVLASCSEYFRAMFTDALKESRLNEICLKGVSAEGLRYLLEFVYTARLPLNLANVQDILATASHIQMFTVVEACSRYLQDQLDMDNCVDVVTIADTYCLHQLHRRAYQFMSGCLSRFSLTADFHQRLTAPQLEHLLACDFPVDCDETQVLNAVVRWLEFDWGLRSAYARQLLANIHFDEVPCPRLSEFADSAVFHGLVGSSGLGAGTAVETRMVTRSMQNQVFALLNIPNSCQTPGCKTKFPSPRTLSLLSLVQRFVYNAPNRASPLFPRNCSVSTPSWLLNSRGMELAIVVVGGFGLGGVTNAITYFLPSTRKWYHLTSIPHVEQCNFGTAVLGNELYVIGGCFNQSLQQESVHPFGFRFDPRAARWLTTAPMQQERCRFSLCALSDQLYAIGGVTEAGESEAGIELSVCERYDPQQDSWSPIHPLPGRRAQHAGVSLNNKLYITGGLEQDTVLSSMVCYDATRDSWESRAPMLTPRADHSAVAYNGCLYICGGWRDENGNRAILDTIDAYDPNLNQWRTVTRLPTPRYHAATVVVGDRLYVIGGFHSDAMMFDRATGCVECYSFTDDAWSAVQCYPQAVWEHCCVTLYIPRYRDDMEVMTDDANGNLGHR